MVASIFWDFTLPNSATWFYFSAFLAVALFYQFTRLFTIRNIDLTMLFVFVPGFLWIQDANELATHVPPGGRATRIFGYAWLLGASLYWFVRCLVDLAAIRRPLVSPNLNSAGLIWFGSALFVGLTGVAYSRNADPWENVGHAPVALTGMQDTATAVVAQAPVATRLSPQDARWWVERTLAMVCHAAVVAGLVLVGAKQFHDLPTGIAAGTFYLLLPYTAYHVGQIHHVWPAALVVWAIYLYHRPAWAGALIGLAAGTTFFPLLLLPIWLQFYKPRGMGRFVGGFLFTWMIGLTTTLVVLQLAGQFPNGMWRALHLADWQPWQIPTAEGIWTGAHWAYRIPVFALYAGFVVTSLVWPPVRNLGHLIALSAAVLIGIQFWFADRGGLYVLWYTPLLVLMALRPNLAEHVPAEPRPWPRAFGRVGRWLHTQAWRPLPPLMLPRLR